MHSGNKGKVGELAVRKDLVSVGYNIYIPEVDTAQVDLIVECHTGIIKKVQVKTAYKLKTETSLEIDTRKYIDTGRVDIIAIYYQPEDIIAYVPFENNRSISLALRTALNNQNEGRKWFYSYSRFPEFS